MANVMLYNKKILYNDKYPIDKHYQTCICLTRKAFENIELISDITNVHKRSNIVENAINYYADYLNKQQRGNQSDG